jgi:hypothetical protein
MEENRPDLIEQLYRDTRQRLPLPPWPPVERPTIHYTELPEDASNSPIAGEWNFYRREVGRLLTDGHEGQWIIIKGEKIIGIWDTEQEADQMRLQRFLGQAVLLKQICVREPIFRGGGYHHGWRR